MGVAASHYQRHKAKERSYSANSAWQEGSQGQRGQSSPVGVLWSPWAARPHGGIGCRLARYLAWGLARIRAPRYTLLSTTLEEMKRGIAKRSGAPPLFFSAQRSEAERGTKEIFGCVGVPRGNVELESWISFG